MIRKGVRSRSERALRRLLLPCRQGLPNRYQPIGRHCAVTEDSSAQPRTLRVRQSRRLDCSTENSISLLSTLSHCAFTLARFSSNFEGRTP
jgi:hypothetical protein